MLRKILLVIPLLMLGVVLLIAITDQPQQATMVDEPLIALNDTESESTAIDQIRPVATTIQAKPISLPANSIEKVTAKTDVGQIRKPIFDGTLYKNKNSDNEQFFQPIQLLYHHISLFRSKENIIEVEYLREVARKLPKSSIPYILDIEIWDVHTTDDIEANKNIDKYILVIDTMKKARPDLKFGYYGVLPNRDYWAPVSRNPQKIAEWKAINQRLKRLAEHVDVVCPSLYVFYNDIDGWKKYATENIKRAREYGKPVYPFLWPQYHNSNRLKSGEFVSEQFWKEQINLVYAQSDGMIIWGGFDLKKESYEKMNWDENAPWWKVTKKFIMDQNR